MATCTLTLSFECGGKLYFIHWILGNGKFFLCKKQTPTHTHKQTDKTHAIKDHDFVKLVEFYGHIKWNFFYFILFHSFSLCSIVRNEQWIFTHTSTNERALHKSTFDSRLYVWSAVNRSCSNVYIEMRKIQWENVFSSFPK